MINLIIKCELGETLNIGTEASNTRYLMNGLFKLIKKDDPNVKVKFNMIRFGLKIN